MIRFIEASKKNVLILQITRIAESFAKLNIYMNQKCMKTEYIDICETTNISNLSETYIFEKTETA